MPDIQGLVNESVSRLKKRKVGGSHATARLTAELLRSVISQVQCADQADALIDAVRAVGDQLIAVNPIELAIGNIVRRVLHIIREEDLSPITSAVGGLNFDSGKISTVISVATLAARSLLRPPSLHALLECIPDREDFCHISSDGDCKARNSTERSARSRKLKHDVIEAINELLQCIDDSHEQIAKQAVEHIHHKTWEDKSFCGKRKKLWTLALISVLWAIWLERKRRIFDNKQACWSEVWDISVFCASCEVILTIGYSKTVMEFLCAAKEKKRSFRVWVTEGAPRCQGHVLAKELVARGLQTTLITDSAVYAMISRVNMVVVGVHAVMANGGVIAPVGLNMVALAARKHAVPFVVVAGSHKLCPLYPHNPETLLNDMRSPSELLDFGEFSDCMDFGNGGGVPLLHVSNPAFDYVPPELVSLFITDIGGHNPSYIYRLIADYYSSDDLVVQRKLDQ